MEYSAKQIASILGGEIIGDENTLISTFSKIEEGKYGSITFLANPKYEEYIYNTEASLVIRNKAFEPKRPIKATQILVEDAYSAFTVLLNAYQKKQEASKSGIEERSFVHEKSILGENIYVGAFAYISKGVQLGDNVKIYPNCFIGENAKIGKNTIVHPGSCIYDHTEIGENCIIFSNCSIGSDGFGYTKNKEGTFEKIAQIGNVIVENNVDIGANTTIDRATMGSTIIRKGSKLDNQIQIAHNVEIGEDTAIASQVGIAGSAKIGKNVILGGQVGVSGHIKVGDGVMAQAQSGIDRSLDDNEKVYGSPAMKYIDFQRSFIYFRKFPEIAKRLDVIEKILRKKSNTND